MVMMAGMMGARGQTNVGGGEGEKELFFAARPSSPSL
jgi:hypothetical protein